MSNLLHRSELFSGIWVAWNLNSRFLVRASNFVKQFGHIFVVNECKSRAASRGPELHLLYAPSCIYFVRCLKIA